MGVGGRAVPLVALALVSSACVTMPPEQAEREAIMWDAARDCEKRFNTIRVKRIDSFGRLWVDLLTETTADWEPFQACYRERRHELTQARARP